jgi:thiol-disulfide isomerase/thioredoxin
MHNHVKGAPFHDFILKDSNGVDVDSRTFRGKYALIVFWASWCGPCRAEHPKLNALYDKYKDHGLQIIGVSIDQDVSKWKEAIRKDELHWTTQVIEPAARAGELAQFYEINAIPTSLLIDKEGKIVQFDIGLNEVKSILRYNR